MAAHLKLGFFEDFKGSDAVLLSGSGSEILDLAQRLRDFATSSGVELPIHDIASVSPEYPARSGGLAPTGKRTVIVIVKHVPIRMRS